MEDENDNRPQFSQAQYTVSLEENSEAGTLVAALTASDPDGEVRTRWRLDREEQEQFLVVVRAEDGAPEDLRLSSSCQLRVLLEDQNDSPPSLTNNPARLGIPDNAGPGDFLYKLEVRDEDRGANSELQYFLLGEGRERFSLDQNTGLLTARSNVGNIGEVFSLQVKVSTPACPLSPPRRGSGWRSAPPLLSPAGLRPQLTR